MIDQILLDTGGKEKKKLYDPGLFSNTRFSSNCLVRKKTCNKGMWGFFKGNLDKYPPITLKF